MKNSSPTPANAAAASAKDRVTAAVIIIGNEILSGRTKDTNLNHIALTLGQWGIQVIEARVIPDDTNEIVTCVNHLRARCDYVFTTGGIGPTHDDITASCIALAFDVPLIEHPEIAALIRSREAPPDIMQSRLRMAQVPQGSGLIANATGGPPGFYKDNVYVMAGIPRVMQAMLAGLDGELRSGAIVIGRSVSAFLAESEIAEALSRVQDEFDDLSIGSYPFMRESRYGTNLVIRGIDRARVDQALNRVVQAIKKAGAEPLDIADA